MIAIILSMFCYSNISNILESVCAIITLFTLPLAVFEFIDHNNDHDGFRPPEYVSDIVRGDLRIPKFKKYEYVGEDNNNVKDILIEPNKDGLNIYHKNMPDKENINYDNILGYELYKKEKIEDTPIKSMLALALFGAIGGFGLGVLGGLVNSFKFKTQDIFRLQYKDKHNNTENLEISSGWGKLKSLQDEIEKNIADDNDNNIS